MIEQLVDRLVGIAEGLSTEAFLYGSQLENPELANDVDILFVVPRDERDLLIEAVGAVQASWPQLIHPVFVTAEEMQANPRLRKLLVRSRQLW